MSMSDRFWEGTDATTPNDLSVAGNYFPNDIRNSLFQWTLSGSGTDEYFVDLSGGGDPGFTGTPGVVEEDGTAMVSGSLGSLAIGEFAFGDNDTLGFSTVYVRLTSAPTDPDANPPGFIRFRQVLVAGDNFFLDGSISNADVLAGLGAWEAIVPGSFEQKQSYAGLCGLRDTPVTILGVTNGMLLGSVSPGQADQGARRMNIALLGTTTDVNVQGTSATSADSGLPPVRITKTSVNGDFSMSSGRVGIALSEEEAAQFDNVVCAGGTLLIGEGTIIDTAISVSNGTIENFGANLTIPITIDSSGIYIARESGTHTDINIRAEGTCFYLSDGAISGTVDNAGIWDTNEDPRTKTVDLIKMYNGATLNADTGNPLSVTFTNPIQIVNARLEDVTIDLGAHFRLAPTAIP